MVLVLWQREILCFKEHKHGPEKESEFLCLYLGTCNLSFKHEKIAINVPQLLTDSGTMVFWMHAPQKRIQTFLIMMTVPSSSMQLSPLGNEFKLYCTALLDSNIEISWFLFLEKADIEAQLPWANSCSQFYHHVVHLPLWGVLPGIRQKIARAYAWLPTPPARGPAQQVPAAPALQALLKPWTDQFGASGRQQG